MVYLHLLAYLVFVLVPAITTAFFADAVFARTAMRIPVSVVAFVATLEDVRPRLTFASNYDYLTMAMTHHWLSDERHSNLGLHVDLSLRWVVSLLRNLLRVDLHYRLLHRVRLLGIGTGLLVVHLLLWGILTGRKLSRRVHSGLTRRICTGRICARRVLTGRHLIGLLARITLHIYI